MKSRKNAKKPVVLVRYTYSGTHEQFTKFLKSVVHEYLSAGNPMLPAGSETEASKVSSES